MSALDSAAVSYAVLLTKRDEVKADEQAALAATLEALRKHPAAYPEVLFTSSRTGEGVPESARACRASARRTISRPCSLNSLQISPREEADPRHIRNLKPRPTPSTRRR